MAREQKVSFGKAIIYNDHNYVFDPERREWVRTEENKGQTVEILDVERIEKDRIVAGRYVLPLSDATIHNSDDGLVYSYNCSLPYLAEAAHLAEVERNIIVGQAFNYAGRTQPGKSNVMTYVLIGVLALLAVIGMFK